MMGDYSDSIFQEYVYGKGTKKISCREDIILIIKNIEDVFLIQFNKDEKMKEFLYKKLNNQT